MCFSFYDVMERVEQVLSLIAPGITSSKIGIEYKGYSQRTQGIDYLDLYIALCTFVDWYNDKYLKVNLLFEYANIYFSPTYKNIFFVL